MSSPSKTSNGVTTRLLREEDIPAVQKLFVETQLSNTMLFFRYHAFSPRYLYSSVPYAVTALAGIALAIRTRSIVKPAVATVGVIATLTGLFYAHCSAIVRGFANMCLRTQMRADVLTSTYIQKGDTHAFIVAIDEATGEFVGCVCLCPFVVGRPEPIKSLAPKSANFTEKNTCELIRMCVAPNVQGRGIGGTLLASVETEARRMGYSNIYLSTSAAQVPAQKLYTRSGFRQLATGRLYPQPLFLPLDLVSFYRKL